MKKIALLLIGIGLASAFAGTDEWKLSVRQPAPTQKAAVFQTSRTKGAVSVQTNGAVGLGRLSSPASMSTPPGFMEVFESTGATTGGFFASCAGCANQLSVATSSTSGGECMICQSSSTTCTGGNCFWTYNGDGGEDDECDEEDPWTPPHFPPGARAMARERERQITREEARELRRKEGRSGTRSGTCGCRWATNGDSIGVETREGGVVVGRVNQQCVARTPQSR